MKNGFLFVLFILLFSLGCSQNEAPEDSVEAVLEEEAPAQALVEPEVAAPPSEAPQSPVQNAPQVPSENRALPVSPDEGQLLQAEVLDIDNLISRSDVRELTGYIGVLRTEQLEGQAPSEDYNSVRFSGEGSLGVAMQVWSFDNSAATNRHFRRLRDTFPDVSGARGAGDAAFRADIGTISQLVFTSVGRQKVVALSCDRQICPDDGVIMEIAEHVESRL